MKSAILTITLLAVSAPADAQLGGLEYIEEIGIAAIRRVCMQLTEDLIARARELGLKPKVAGSAAERSAIVMIPSRDPQAAVRGLAHEGIIADARPGHVRLSPFFYNVQEALVKVDRHGKLVPWLAEK